MPTDPVLPAPGALARPGPPFPQEVIVSSNGAVPTCPHCGEPLLPFALPEAVGWESPFQLACWSDDCPYYVRGWTCMESEYGVRSSYRYRLDPGTGAASPLPVWSSTAIGDYIIEADVEVAREGGVVVTAGSGGSHEDHP